MLNWSLIAVFMWVILANAIAILPSKRNHWPAAYGLIAIGIPILGWVTYENGPWIGLIAMAAGISILRWPVRYLGRWVRRKTVGTPEHET